MRIYLVGMMGSGKSTVGRKLALRLGYEYYDLDEQMEESSGRTISEMFEEDGEEAFRFFESMALKNIAMLDNLVLATGGGAPCFHDSMKLMLRTGPTIYLKADINFLASRLVQSEGRPLIGGLSGEALKQKLTEILNERGSIYEKSKFSFDAMNIGSTEIEEMVEMIGKR